MTTFLLLLLACPGKLTDTGEADETGDADTGETDDSGETGETGDSDTGETGETGETGDSGTASIGANWAITGLSVADTVDSFDLDGDGEPDNALADSGRATVALMNNLLEEALATATRSLVVQVWDIDSWTDDAEVDVGLFAATGTDTTDVYAPAEGTLLPSGQAIAHTTTALEGGVYRVELLENELVLGDMELSSATPIVIGGSPTEPTHTGVLAFSLSIATIEALATATGLSEISKLAALADLDTDADGTPDAVSLALAFDADACTLQ